MKILGISAFYHDSAAALVVDGEIVAAAQEERFTRKKHDFRFPIEAAKYCLREGGIGAADLDYVGFYDKPLVKFERILETYMAYAPAGIASFLQAMPLWTKQKLWLPQVISKELEYKGKILFAEHHVSHAASAFFPSPYPEAAILTLDGVGEWATASYGVGRGNKIELMAELPFPHSLGLLYSAFTYYTGFRVNSGEYKLMGLAPYGQPVFADTIRKKLIHVHEDGSLRLNMKYFAYAAGLRMVNKRFCDLFGAPARKPETPIRQVDMDVASSIQMVTEEIMLKMARHVHRETGMKNLCLAGGVALNCVGNGRLLREGPFEGIWIQPAAGDAGGALGVALDIWHEYLDNPRTADGKKDVQKATLIGPAFSEEEIESFLRSESAPAERLEWKDVPERVAELIAGEKVIGWFQGRMEFGPRALGARSIIGDARSTEMQATMNLKIKYRESFRPFAPTVLEERVSDYFDMNCSSPYMLLVAQVSGRRMKALSETDRNVTGLDRRKVARSEVPAITHVDGSARIQTVSREQNPIYHEMISAFERRTGCPVIINTSFNVRGEPIVCSPRDAFRCFMRTEMDYLILGRFLLDKKQQKPLEKDTDWMKEYELD